MKEFVGKACRIRVKVKDQYFFYTVREVTKYEEPHISFIDKYDKHYTYHKEEVRAIREEGEAW